MPYYTDRPEEPLDPNFRNKLFADLFLPPLDHQKKTTPRPDNDDYKRGFKDGKAEGYESGIVCLLLSIKEHDFNPRLKLTQLAVLHEGPTTCPRGTSSTESQVYA
jgi:hypothetical protein